MIDGTLFGRCVFRELQDDKSKDTLEVSKVVRVLLDRQIEQVI